MIATLNQTVEIGGGRGRLLPEHAASIRRVDKALGRLLDINSAWRDPDTQQDLYEAYVRDPKNNPIAFKPEDSVHCAGAAVDSDDGYSAAVIRVLNDHGWFQTVYRWVNGKRVLVEPWHFERDASRDNHRYEGDPATSVARPFPTSIQGDDMSIIIVAASAGGFIKKGMAFADNLTEPLTVLTAKELEALDYAKEHQGIPYRKAVWDAPTILKLINERGIRPQTGPLGAAEYTKVNY